MKRFFHFCRKLIYQGWIIVGIVILMLLLLEGILYPVSKLGLLNEIPTEARMLTDENAPKPPSFAQVDWYEKFVDEFSKVAFNLHWTPYTYWRTNPFTGKYINIVHNSIRKTWAPKAPLSHNNHHNNQAIRIFMFGGSTLWGWGVRDDFTIPSLVARILYEEHKIDAEVTNFGEIGYVSTQEIIELIKALQLNHLPNLVIFYDGLNDVVSTLRPGQTGEVGISCAEIERKQSFEEAKLGFMAKLIHSYTTQSTLFQILGKMVERDPLKPVQQLSRSQIDDISNSIIRVYLENIRMIKSLGNAYQFQTLFYWHPIIFTKTELTTHEQKLEEIARALLYNKPVYQLTNQKLLSKKNEDFHNISDILPNDQHSYYIDLSHIDEQGNEIIARRMVQDILKRFPNQQSVQINYKK